MSKCPTCGNDLDVVQALSTYDESQGGRQKRLVDAAINEILALREKLSQAAIPRKRGRPKKVKP